MDSSKTVVAKALGAAIQKQAAVALFDRFGEDNQIFLQQFEKGKEAQRELEQCLESSRLERLIKKTRQLAQTKKSEFRLVKEYMIKKEAERVAELCESVRELKEDLEFDLQQALSAAEGEPIDSNGVERGSNVGLRDDILAWRLDTLPRVRH